MNDDTAHTDHAGHDGHQNHDMGGRNSMALSATLHCLTGCAIGEIAGLMIGTAIGLSTGWTLMLAVSLAFLFGYTLSRSRSSKPGSAPAMISLDASTREPRLHHLPRQAHRRERQPGDRDYERYNVHTD